MERNGNDEVDAQLSEPLCVVSGPKSPDTLGQRFAGSVFHGQDRVAE